MRSMKSVAHSTPKNSGFNKKDDALYRWLEGNYAHFNKPSFIADDPISVPHHFDVLQDIEIAGFFTSIMAWGQRKTIINKAKELMHLMDDAPYDFMRHHQESDRKRFTSFKHRTLQPDDVLYLIDVLQRFYKTNSTLEQAFTNHMRQDDENVYHGLVGFHNMIFDQPWVLERTRKHIATPIRKSSCKRLNMFLRWMVRSDNNGVDFGLWKNISTAKLIIPLDVHVGNVARKLNLLDRKSNDWRAATELTERLRIFDKNDPVKYDFALFGAGVNQVDH
jgi:uncharacterized protein (TIGR02757 family)